MTMEPDHPLAVATAPHKDSKHWTQGTVTWGELQEWAQSPADHRECGNYVLGTLKGDLRRKDTIVSRSALSLDLDYATPTTADEWELSFPYAGILHTTWRSTPDAPRYRLIVPLDRELAPDEYDTAARAVMQEIGEALFDHQSPQPERFMFKPSTQDPDLYDFRILQGPPASASVLLESFQADLSTIPLPKPSRNKRDPFELQGVIGAFNRVYQDLGHLVQTYDLPYEHAGADRWHLTGATSAAGMGQVAPGLWYSHHSGDPAAGHAANAFDLARAHKFGHLDEDLPEDTPVNRLPSQDEMMSLAMEDEAVTTEMSRHETEVQEESMREFLEVIGQDTFEELDAAGREAVEESVSTASTADTVRDHLTRNPKSGKVEDTAHNWRIIREHDPAMKALSYNLMSSRVEVTADLPWRTLEEDGVDFTDSDRGSLSIYLQDTYDLRASQQHLSETVLVASRTRRYHPLKDYLTSLEWDGTPRVETSLPGVRDTPYARLVARKCFTAAVKRIMEPGCEWHHMLIIFGGEGTGKTSWVKKVSRGFYKPIRGPRSLPTLLALEKSWIMLDDECATMAKAESTDMKGFITDSEDTFKRPYGTDLVTVPRHTVLWGTTNNPTIVPREDGTRRYLVVHSETERDFDALTDDYVDQLWAEAMHFYLSGESLIMTKEEEALVSSVRERYTEEDALSGLIQHYLETPVPEGWETWTADQRRVWMETSDRLDAQGVALQESVCAVQLWKEALGNYLRNPSRQDIKDIRDVMDRIPGWEREPKTRRLYPYGPQSVYSRTAASNEDLL